MIRELYFWLLGNPLVFLGGSVAGVTITVLLLPRTQGLLRILNNVALILSGSVIAATVALYYSRALFLDHVEAQVAAVSIATLGDLPLYHALDGTAAYSGGPYGPGIFLLTQATYHLLGPGLIAAKLAAAAAVALTLSSLWLMRAKSPANWTETGFAIALSCIALPYCAFFWLRSDPWLLACAAVGNLCALRGGRTIALLGAGISFGFACWFKLHAPLYFIPAWCLLVVRYGLPRAIVAGGLAGLVAMGQFLPWAGRGENYVALVRVYAGFGSGSWSKVLTNLQWAVVMLIPAWLPLCHAGGRARWRADAEARWQSLALAAATLAASIVGSRPGAGYWHLLPLVPAAVVTGSLLRGPVDDKARDFRPVILSAWSVLAAFLIFTRYDDVVLRLWRNPGAAEVHEIEAVLQQHPRQPVLMGLGSDRDGAGYLRTFQRAYLVSQGQPYPSDPVVMMDLLAVGVPQKIAAPPRLLLPGQETIVLIPHGEAPFTMPNFFGGQCVPESFRADFMREFSLIQAGRCYDVWQRNRAPQAH